MNSAKEMLLKLPAEKEVALTFSDGEKLVLKNFDVVDESIYGRSDLVSATLVEVLISDKKRQSVGSMLDFSILETMKIFDINENTVLFER